MRRRGATDWQPPSVPRGIPRHGERRWWEGGWWQRPAKMEGRREVEIPINKLIFQFNTIITIYIYGQRIEIYKNFFLFMNLKLFSHLIV